MLTGNPLLGHSIEICFTRPMRLTVSTLYTALLTPFFEKNPGRARGSFLDFYQVFFNRFPRQNLPTVTWK